MPSDYNFEPYIQATRGNWYEDDAFLQKLLHALAPEALHAEADALARVGAKAAEPWREWADASDSRPVLPRLTTPEERAGGADDVLLPESTLRHMRDAYSEITPWDQGADLARYAKLYLLSQNGEAGVLCSVACTDGLVRVLARKGTDKRSREVLKLMLTPEGAGHPKGFLHGAQFVTEIQGGSDAGANRVEAVPAEHGLWRLSGQKFFCSNFWADYWAVTARYPDGPEGSEGVGLFLVERRLSNGRPNGYTVERLKEKLGTRALPTAEIQLEGSLGWPVGPLEKGLANMVGIVLTASRVYNTLGSAALVRQAHRHAQAYASYRKAFGRSIAEFAVPADTLASLKIASQRLTAGAFGVLDRWLAAQDKNADDETKLVSRFLVMLSKPSATRRGTHWVHEAMMLLGGNGIEEEFSLLPRLYRDAAIFETWEGPHTLLYAQCMHDMLRFGVPGREQELVDRMLSGAPGSKELAEELSMILKRAEDTSAQVRFAAWGSRCYQAFEEAVWDRVAGNGKGA